MEASRSRLSGFRSLLAVLGCVLILSATSAFAQLSSASLNGVVRDSTGAVMTKAMVVLRNVDTGLERTTPSNEIGNYVFSDVPPGRYTLRVTAPSFTTKQVSEFVLAVNQTATIDVVLTPGSQTEVISVEATTEQLQASTAELGTVIATKQVNDLPLNGRNFTQLLSLTPGVSPISVGQNAMGGRIGGFAAPIAEGAAFSSRLAGSGSWSWQRTVCRISRPRIRDLPSSNEPTPNSSARWAERRRSGQSASSSIPSRIWLSWASRIVRRSPQK